MDDAESSPTGITSPLESNVTLNVTLNVASNVGTHGTPVHRPVHDRPTYIAYASLATWAWFAYGFGATLAFLREEEGTSNMIGGLHGSALALGGFAGALIASRLIEAIGRGRVMRVGSLGAIVGILIFSAPAGGVGFSLAGAFIASFFGSLIVVGVNAFIASHQGGASAAAFTESNALAALAGFLAPVTIGVAAASVLGWRAGLWVSVLAFLCIELARGRKTKVFGVAGEVKTRKESGALPAATYWALVAGMCYIGAEFCMSLWGVDLMRQQVGMSAAGAAAALGALTGGLFVGRVFGSRLAQRMPSERLLAYSAVAGLLCFAAVWFAGSAPIMVTSLFATGVCLSLQWPLALARILRSSKGRDDRAAGAAMAYTTAAIGVAPFALGAMTGVMPIHTAFLLVPLLLGISLALILLRPVADVDDDFTDN